MKRQNTRQAVLSSTAVGALFGDKMSYLSVLLTRQSVCEARLAYEACKSALGWPGQGVQGCLSVCFADRHQAGPTGHLTKIVTIPSHVALGNVPWSPLNFTER